MVEGAKAAIIKEHSKIKNAHFEECCVVIGNFHLQLGNKSFYSSALSRNIWPETEDFYILQKKIMVFMENLVFLCICTTDQPSKQSE